MAARETRTHWRLLKQTTNTSALHTRALLTHVRLIVAWLSTVGPVTTASRHLGHKSIAGCVLVGVVADNGEVWYDVLYRTVHRTVHRIVRRILQDGVPLFLVPTLYHTNP